MKKIFERLEGIPATFTTGFFAFASLIVIKAFLENFANGSIDGFFTADINLLLHYFVWFSGSFLTLTLLVYLVTKRDILKISKYMLAVHVLIWVTAIIDMAAYRGEHKLSYIYLGVGDLLKNVFTAGINYGGVGLGQMIIIPTIAAITGLYVYYCTRKYARSILGACLIYFGIFAWGAFPSLFRIGYNLFHGRFLANEPAREVGRFFLLSGENSALSFNIVQPQTVQLGTRLQELVQVNLFSQLFFAAVVILFAVWAYLASREKFVLVVGNIRFFGIIHYYLNFLIGLLLAATSPLLNVNWATWLSGAIVAFAYYAAYMYALGVNDISDLQTDKVSNSNRPLPRGKLSNEDLKEFNFAFLILALVAAYLSGIVIFYAVLVAVMASYVYSVQPLRLKRVPFVSTFLIGLASLTAVLSGFYFLHFTKAISSFPLSFAAAILMFHTLWGAVKDLKDREGDRADKVITFANLFSEKGSRLAVSALAVLGYLSVPLVLGIPALIFVSIAAAAVTAWMIFKNRLQNNYPLFFVYYLYTASVIIIVGVVLS